MKIFIPNLEEFHTNGEFDTYYELQEKVYTPKGVYAPYLFSHLAQTRGKKNIITGGNNLITRLNKQEFRHIKVKKTKENQSPAFSKSPTISSTGIWSLKGNIYTTLFKPSYTDMFKGHPYTEYKFAHSTKKQKYKLNPIEYKTGYYILNRKYGKKIKIKKRRSKVQRYKVSTRINLLIPFLKENMEVPMKVIKNLKNDSLLLNQRDITTYHSLKDWALNAPQLSTLKGLRFSFLAPLKNSNKENKEITPFITLNTYLKSLTSRQTILNLSLLLDIHRLYSINNSHYIRLDGGEVRSDLGIKIKYNKV